MSKYTNEQLQARAIAAQRYRNDCPNSYADMIMYVMMFTGLDQQQVEQRINNMANGDFNYE